MSYGASCLLRMAPAVDGPLLVLPNGAADRWPWVHELRCTARPVSLSHLTQAGPAELCILSGRPSKQHMHHSRESSAMNDAVACISQCVPSLTIMHERASCTHALRQVHPQTTKHSLADGFFVLAQVHGCLVAAVYSSTRQGSQAIHTTQIPDSRSGTECIDRSSSSAATGRL